MSMPSWIVVAVPLPFIFGFTSTDGRPTPPAAKLGAVSAAGSRGAGSHAATATVQSHVRVRLSSAIMAHLLRDVRPMRVLTGDTRNQAPHGRDVQSALA